MDEWSVYLALLYIDECKEQNMCNYPANNLVINMSVSQNTFRACKYLKYEVICKTIMNQVFVSIDPSIQMLRIWNPVINYWKSYHFYLYDMSDNCIRNCSIRVWMSVGERISSRYNKVKYCNSIFKQANTSHRWGKDNCTQIQTTSMLVS